MTNSANLCIIPPSLIKFSLNQLQMEDLFTELEKMEETEKYLNEYFATYLL